MAQIRIIESEERVPQDFLMLDQKLHVSQKDAYSLGYIQNQDPIVETTIS